MMTWYGNAKHFSLRSPAFPKTWRKRGVWCFLRSMRSLGRAPCRCACPSWERSAMHLPRKLSDYRSSRNKPKYRGASNNQKELLFPPKVSQQETRFPPKARKRVSDFTLYCQRAQTAFFKTIRFVMLSAAKHLVFRITRPSLALAGTQVPGSLRYPET